MRQAAYTSRRLRPRPLIESDRQKRRTTRTTLLKILASPNVASKEWIVRQYDHEVQGGSVVKPFVGVANDGPSDAAVIRPVLGSRRGVVIACGMNPRYGDFDTYHMAASAIDEAIRNCVAVGADPRGSRFSTISAGAIASGRRRWAAWCGRRWLATTCRSRSARRSSAARTASTTNSVTSMTAAQRQTIAIPPSLLISAMGQVDDVAKCVTMDLKQRGNLLYLVGETRDELGGSHYCAGEWLGGWECADG